MLKVAAPKAPQGGAKRRPARRRREAPPRPTARKSLSAEGAIVLISWTPTAARSSRNTDISCTVRISKGRRQQPARVQELAQHDPQGGENDPNSAKNALKVLTKINLLGTRLTLAIPRPGGLREAIK